MSEPNQENKARLELNIGHISMWLNRLCAVTESINRNNGFDTVKWSDWGGGDPNTDKLLAKIALMHEELSEAVTEVRKGTREACLEELADCVIRCMDTAQGLHAGVALEHSFGEILVRKLIKNCDRGYKHGKRC